jgi:integrase/recombinase XerD
MSRWAGNAVMVCTRCGTRWRPGYDAGVPLPYIRDILGHVDLSTTEIYARASTEAKRKALEAVYADLVTAGLAEWNQNPELLSWLASL